MLRDKSIFLPAVIGLLVVAIVLLLTGFSILQRDYFIAAVDRDGGTDLGIVQAGVGKFKHVLSESEEIGNVTFLDNDEFAYLCGSDANTRAKSFSMQNSSLNNDADIRAARCLHQEMGRRLNINIDGADDRKASPAGLEEQGKACHIPGTSYYLYLADNTLNIYESTTRAVFETGARGAKFYIAGSNGNEKLAIAVPEEAGTTVYLYNLQDMYLIGNLDIPGKVIQMDWHSGAGELIMVYFNENGSRYYAIRCETKSNAQPEILYDNDREFNLFYAEADAC